MTSCERLAPCLMWQLIELWPQAVADMDRQACWDAFDGMYTIPKPTDLYLPMGDDEFKLEMR